MSLNYIKWGFESRLKQGLFVSELTINYIKWGFESRLKLVDFVNKTGKIISNGDLKVG